MIEIHRPKAGQRAKITYIASDLLPDMGEVISGVFNLRGPNGGAAVVIPATIGTRSSKALDLIHAWDPSTGEAQTAGTHSIWATLTTTDGDVDTQPTAFRVKESWETTTQ